MYDELIEAFRSGWFAVVFPTEEGLRLLAVPMGRCARFALCPDPGVRAHFLAGFLLQARAVR